MMKLYDLEKELQKLANPEQAMILQRFFKTGPGEYGEGDCFLGIKVPILRAVVKQYEEVTMAEINHLLRSPFHECRMVALFMLIRKYNTGDDKLKERIFNLYLKSCRFINNWDLVDLTAPNIVGHYLADKNRKVLYTLVKSHSIWERRISILATFYFIRQNDFQDTFRLADKLMKDNEDLIHKATGWMLREIGKRDLQLLENFLCPRYKKMPRTMLRYAIEKFPESLRQQYLKGTI
jgi:3-methyladenine DNA glycosylase AlkD